MNERDALKKLTAILARQQEVLKRLATDFPPRAQQSTEWPDAIDGTIPRNERDDYDDYINREWHLRNPLLEDLPAAKMIRHKEDVPFDDDKHVPSVEYEAMHDTDQWDDPYPLENANTQKTFKLPEERRFKHPDETDE